MTILTIETAVASTEVAADTIANITRTDIREGSIRMFAGRKVLTRIALAEVLGDHKHTKATEERIAGILAALEYPTSECTLRDRIEAGLDEAARRTGSVIPNEYRYGYGEDQNNGDAMALALKEFCGGGLEGGIDLTKLEEVVDTNGIRDRYDTWLVKGLNNGMLRMNAGNVLRGKFRKGEVISIGSQKWNAEA